MGSNKTATLGEARKFAQEVLNKASEIFGVSVDKFSIINNPLRESSAEFSPKENKIILNIAHNRTFRDIVFSIGHEFGHVVQANKLTPMKMLFLYQLSVSVLGYRDCHFEIEADEAGFKFEEQFKYKNRIFNPACKTSVFVNRKQVRNSLS